MKVDFVSAALPYAERLHWKVVLLGSKWKLPFLAKEAGGCGVHGASADPDQIRAWGKLCPDGNVGIACGDASEIVVVDVDPRNAGDTSIRALAARGYSFPKGPRQRTGNGGWHLFFQHQPDIVGSKNRLRPGVDLKSDGGYVLVAPSWTRPSDAGPGGPYLWEVSPFDVPVPRMPIWMTTMLRPAPRPKPAFTPDVNGSDIDLLARFVAASTKGERNNRLFWAACRAAELVAQRRLSSPSAEAVLLRAALASGLSTNRAAATIRSGMRHG
jgi:Bifunctional DNA primase/polymerase, N-terminal